MKNLVRTLIFTLSASLMVACGDDGKKKNQINHRTNPGFRQPLPANGQTPVQNSVQPNPLWGEVLQAQGQGNFRDSVIFFLSTDSDQAADQAIGEISGSPNAATGVRIAGYVNSPGNYQFGQSSYSVPNGQGVLYVVIWDSLANQRSPLTLSFNLSSGNVTAQGAQLTFSDAHGSVTLNGSFNGQNLEGGITFTNNVGPYAGQNYTLGYFRIPACGFIAC